MTETTEICGHIGGDSSGAIATVCQREPGHSGKHAGMGCEWDSAATPGRIVGDKGQRFEVHTMPSLPAGKHRGVAGWHSTLDGAKRMADSLVLHPEVEEVWVFDRANRWERVYQNRKDAESERKGGEDE